MNKTPMLALSLASLLILPCAALAAGKKKPASENRSVTAKASQKAASQKKKNQKNQKNSRAQKKKSAQAPRKRGGKQRQQDPAPSTVAGVAVGAEVSPERSGKEVVEQEKSRPAPQITGRVIHGSIYGQLNAGQKVAVVDISSAFEVIPAYQKIKREKLKKTKAQYHILIAQANDEFLSAVEAEALHGGIGLVVETGGVRGVQVVDITESVRKRLKK